MVKQFYKVLYLIGVLITLVAAGIAIWPDFEARSFSQTFTGKDRASFSCPIAMTTNEVADIHLTIHNSLERRARFAAISFVTSNNQASRPAEERQEIYIDPNSSDTLTWQIDQSNRVYDNMILARVYAFRSGRVPSQSASCGVWLFGADWATNSGLLGKTIYQIFLGVGLTCMAVGGIGASEAKNPLALVDRSNGRPRVGIVLTAIVLSALALGLLGLPMAGIFTILAAVLLMFALVEQPPSSLGD